MIRLQCLDGGGEGRTFEFEKSRVVLGRNADCDLSLDDELCSRQHACIQLTDGSYVLTDLDSTNGVQVNGTRVKRTEIRYGDRFVIGRSLFVFLGDVPMEDEELDGEDSGREPSGTIIEQTQTLGAIEERFREINRRAQSLGEGPRELSQAEFEELQNANRQMHAIYRLSRDINSTLHPEDLYDRITENIFDNFPEVERVCIFIAGKKNDTLKCIKNMSRGAASDLPVSRDVLQRARDENVGIMATDAQTDDRFGDSNTLITMNVRSLMCAPLTTRSRFLGAIYAENCRKVSCFSRRDLELLTVLGNQAAMAIENALLYEELQVSFYEAIRSLGNALEAKDRYTRGHSQRVAEYAVGIGREMKLERQRIENLRIAAELHDIGKIAIGEGIINAERKLSDEEFAVIKQHPRLGVEILQPIGFLKPILPIVLHHHERYNGRGYPDQLKGEEIPLEARILNLADAFDAMTTQRPYNTPRSVDGAMAHCLKEAGVSFDAGCVEALAKFLEKRAAKDAHGQRSVPEAVASLEAR
jgi:HD-GYP domain-containing protein (c-di-GMP phosphodiesterase class II)